MTIDLRSQFVRPPSPGLISRRGLLKTGLTLTGFAGIMLPGTTAYAAMEAANGLSITDYRLTPPGWPAGQPLTIAVIADLHAGGPNMGIERVRQVVDAGNALACDLVVLMGDYFATHRFITEHVAPPEWAAELARLRAPLGVYSILGNHDWWYDITGVRSALAHVRIPVMENDAVLLGEGRHRFWLAGLGDQLAHRIGPGRFRGVDDLPGTLKKVTTDDPVILLAHEPDIFPEVPNRVALTLAGSHPWRPDPSAADPAVLGAVGLWRAFRLWPHRRARPPFDRLGRARHQQGAACGLVCRRKSCGLRWGRNPPVRP